jgi:hypothetical protein
MPSSQIQLDQGNRMGRNSLTISESYPDDLQQYEKLRETLLTICRRWQQRLYDLWLSEFIFEEEWLETIQNGTSQDERLFFIHHGHQ